MSLKMRPIGLSLLAACTLIAACVSQPAPGLSEAELQQTLAQSCRQQFPAYSAAEIDKCVLDAAQTYARGLETFQQNYPLAPVRVQCGAVPAGNGAIKIDCK